MNKEKENVFLKYKKWVVLFSSALIILFISIPFQIIFGNFFASWLPSYVEVIGIVIQVLVPLTPTIISIFLSLNNERIYGLKRSEFNFLRENSSFNTLGMTLISLSFLLCYFLFSLLQLQILLIGLCLETFFISFWFSYQQLGLLINSKNAQAILRNYFFNHNGVMGFEMGPKAKFQGFQKAFCNMLFTEGIKSSYYLFKNKQNGSRVLLDLLSVQNQYLFRQKSKENLDDLKNTEIGTDIFQILNTAISNLEECLDPDSGIPNSENLPNKTYFYEFTRSIFLVHSLSKRVNEVNSCEHKISKLIYFLLTNKDQEELANCILNSMTVYSFCDLDNKWFFQCMLDVSSGALLFDKFYNYYGFSITFLIYYFYLNKGIDNSADFLQLKMNGPNSFGERLSLAFKNSFILLNKYDFLNLFKIQINIFKDNDLVDFNYDLAKKGTFTPRPSFSVGFIFTAWLELLLCGTTTFFYEKSDFETLFSSFSYEIKKQIAKELDSSWFPPDGGLSIKHDFRYAYLMGLRTSPFISPDLGEYLFKFKNDTLKSQINQELKQSQTQSASNQTIIEEFNKNFNNWVKSIPFPLSNDYPLTFNTCDSLIDIFGMDNPSSVLKWFVDQISNKFYLYLYSCFLKKLGLCRDDLKYSLDDEDAQSIVKFKPDFKNSKYDYFSLKEDDPNVLDLKRIKSFDCSFLPRLTYWKREGIKLSLKFDPEKTSIRSLTPNEIENIIRNEYTENNGLYHYRRYINDKRVVLVSKDELRKIIGQQYVVLSYSFGFKFEIHSELICCVKNNSK